MKTYEGASTEQLSSIQSNECEDGENGLRRARFRRLWNEYQHMRKLLAKYMDHVGECEGVTFVNQITVTLSGDREQRSTTSGANYSRVTFTPQEALLLQEIDRELRK